MKEYSKYNLERLTDIRASLEKQFDEMQKDINILRSPLKKQDLEKWSGNYLSSFYESNIKTLDDVKKYRDKYELEFKEIKEKHELNIPIIENNQKVYEQAIKFMQDLGLSKSESYQKRRYGKTYSKTAEWLASIDKMIPTTDNFGSYEATYKSRIYSLDEFERKIKNENYKKEQEIKKEQESKEKEVKLIKFGLELKKEFNDLLEDIYTVSYFRDFLLNKDKFLCLAYNMESTRNDWSNGCYAVEDNLHLLDQSIQIERDIYDELYDFCDDFEDGRCFRDCQYNYSVLYNMADDNILRLWQELCNISGYIFDYKDYD